MVFLFSIPMIVFSLYAYVRMVLRNTDDAVFISRVIPF